LHPYLNPSDIVILTGGDRRPRQGSFADISWRQIKALAETHGYCLENILDLPFDKRLEYKGVRFAPYWLRVFAMPAAAKKYPEARYFVWLDDDVMVPYASTHMLAHYINILYSEPGGHFLFTSDVYGRPINSGIFIMRNVEWAHEFMMRVREVGLEDGARLAHKIFHEQEAISILNEREGLWKSRHIMVVSKRQGHFNINTFFVQAKFGDAFIHLAGLSRANRDRQAKDIEGKAQKLVSLLKTRFNLPLDIENLKFD
jgi:hypothetical protein